MSQEDVWVIGSDIKTTAATSEQVEQLQQQRRLEKYYSRIRAAEDIMRGISYQVHVSILNKMLGNAGEENERS